MAGTGSPPLVTVVLTSYNHARFIDESLYSVLGQSVTNLEVIVIDDCSTDGSWQRLQAVRDPRVSVVRNGVNRGRHSRNWAMRHATGAFIAFQNSDDVWHPDKLAHQLEFLERHPGHGVCFTAVDLRDSEGAARADHPVFGRAFRVETHDRFGWLRRFFLAGNCLAHPSAVMRRDLLARIGVYDSGLFQLPDFDLWVRAAGVCELAVLPTPLTTFRIHDDNTNSSSPSPANWNRAAAELVEVLAAYGRPPILHDVEKIFGIDAGAAPDDSGDVARLAALGLYATTLHEWHHQMAGVQFLREALRRGDELNVLDEEHRSRIALCLHRMSGKVTRRGAFSGPTANRFLTLARATIGVLGAPKGFGGEGP